MSLGSESGSTMDFTTARGRDYPTLVQFTVFLENRVGQLMEVLRRFEKSRVVIVSLSVTESVECAIVRLVLSDPEAGREILERAGLALVESQLVGVELPEGPQPLLQICTALLRAEVNIHQVYPLLLQPSGRPSVALQTENLEMAAELLESRGFRLVREGDLREDG